ncbi:IS3 family transposase [Methyloversatilis sp. XJ19-49]|uniref:IS3 family transposase n=1 Tax=Methyloversatilis sp. XJ19-49 TaxID=2963429 RepID=UPI00359C5713
MGRDRSGLVQLGQGQSSRQARGFGHQAGPGNDTLLAHIKAIHAQTHGGYGWPRITKELLARGVRAGKDRVRSCTASAPRAGAASSPQ